MCVLCDVVDDYLVDVEVVVSGRVWFGFDLCGIWFVGRY